MRISNRSQATYSLFLYVSGATPRSRRAITNIKSVCEEHLKGRYRLNVVDIYQNPEQLAKHDIVAAPTLIKETPLPVRRFVGDLSDRVKVARGLALSVAA